MGFGDDFNNGFTDDPWNNQWDDQWNNQWNVSNFDYDQFDYGQFANNNFDYNMYGYNYDDYSKFVDQYGSYEGINYLMSDADLWAANWPCALAWINEQNEIDACYDFMLIRALVLRKLRETNGLTKKEEEQRDIMGGIWFFVVLIISLLILFKMTNL